ncbi:YicC/YloC family endoribonuclease [Agarilytica rhodophyticola]|uniref:YicC/YloC family endoribonuclease n=1 Tax=Agarilytica rhodophyticola TaxID=1737490 RepID=UPI000B344DB9|nr:YicC/YloC family endoribonuclease [Agarilytica rhodophyticola]
MPRSMTGFARQEFQHPWGVLSCEIRSVNHRYLEPSFRLPETLRSLEPILRDLLRKNLSRGKVEVAFSLKTDLAEDARLGLNEKLADQIVELAQLVQDKLTDPAKLNPIDILRWPAVIKTAEIEADVLTQAGTDLFEKTLEELIANRVREGSELAQMIEKRLVNIGEQVEFVREKMPQLLEAHQQKLRAKLETLKVDVDEERFSQEAVYIAQKVDIAEEVDRLEAHLSEVRHTLKQNGPIGRRLDFLMQELNREANTLSSKSIATDTTQSSVDIKVFIEQMREQVQNIE